MVNIAILGYGVVGSGVLEIIKKNGAAISKKTGKEVRVKRYWISGIFLIAQNGVL